MAKKPKSNNKIWHWVVSAIIFLAILFVAQAYVLGPRKAIGRGVLEYLPLPAGFVNANAILLGDYYTRINVAEKIENRQLSSDEQKKIFDQLVENEMVATIARAKGVAVSAQELDQGYAYLQKVSQNQNLATEYALSESRFKKEIVAPDLLKTKLAVWLASNKTINKEAYAKLDLVMGRLNNGVAFDNVAIALSEDQKSAQIGGDLGFVSDRDLVPELFSQFASMKDKDPHVLVSRYGIHVVEILGTDNKGLDGSTRYHVKQIFIKTTDFDTWVLNQKSNYSVLRFVSF